MLEAALCFRVYRNRVSKVTQAHPTDLKVIESLADLKRQTAGLSEIVVPSR
jgi:hypothetical protein